MEQESGADARSGLTTGEPKWPMTYTYYGKPADKLTHEEKDEMILGLLRQRDEMWERERKRPLFTAQEMEILEALE